MPHYSTWRARLRRAQRRVTQERRKRRAAQAREKVAIRQRQNARAGRRLAIRQRDDKEEERFQAVEAKEVAELSLTDELQKGSAYRLYFEDLGLAVPAWPFDPNDPADPNQPDDPNRPRPRPRDCIDFEDLAAAAVYPHGSTFSSEGCKFEVVPEPDPAVQLPADPATSGQVEVQASPGPGVRNCPFDFGQSLMVNNCLVKLDVTQKADFPQGAPSACFKYCDLGGHAYLRINGEAWDFSAFAAGSPGTSARELKDYDGMSLGGVDVRVTKMLYGTTSSSGAPVNDHFGMVFLTANSDLVRSIEVGGQEFWTDYWCVPCTERPRDDPPGQNPTSPRDCIDFEDMAAGAEYPHSAGLASEFWSEGVRFESIAEPAVMLPFDPAVSGKVVVEADPGAGLRNCPHDFGQYIRHDNCLAKLDVTQIPAWSAGAYTACFKYCDMGGHCYLRVNGRAWDFGVHAEAAPGLNAPELMAYDGLVMGGVRVRVTKFAAVSPTGASLGGHFGMVFLEADSDRIFTIEVGGQEFWTDYWCVPCTERPPLTPPDNPPPTTDNPPPTTQPTPPVVGPPATAPGGAVNPNAIAASTSPDGPGDEFIDPMGDHSPADDPSAAVG